MNEPNIFLKLSFKIPVYFLSSFFFDKQGHMQFDTSLNFN